MPTTIPYNPTDQLKAILSLCEAAEAAGLVAIAVSQVEEIAALALHAPAPDPTTVEGRRITDSELKRGFVDPVSDVMARMDLTRRQQARLIAQMYAEHWEAARTDIVQACADVARGWDPIEAALAGSGVAQDIADGIVNKMLKP